MEVIELNGANQPLDVFFKVCQQIFIFMEKRSFFVKMLRRAFELVLTKSRETSLGLSS